MEVLVRRAITNHYDVQTCMAAFSTACALVELWCMQPFETCALAFGLVMVEALLLCRVADGIDGKADGALFVTAR